MGEEKPEAKDWLGKNVEHGVGDNFGIDANDTGTIGNTPDARACQEVRRQRSGAELHWVDRPEDEGETSDGSKESLSLAVLASSSRTAVEGELVDDSEIGEATKSIPAPLLTIFLTESSKETSHDHDQIGNNGNENVGTTEAGQEAKIEEQEWGGEGPVNITSVVDLTEDILDGVWDMLGVLLDDRDVLQRDASTGGHCEVGEEGEGGDEGSDDMEESFLLTRH